MQIFIVSNFKLQIPCPKYQISNIFYSSDRSKPIPNTKTPFSFKVFSLGEDLGEVAQNVKP